MNDFFTQPRIKKLRKIAGGDTYTIIYLKLQLLSLKNNGALIFEGIEENIVEELALTIDEDIDNVQVTFNYLVQQGLIEPLENESYLLTETQYLIGSETASTVRSRKSREKQKTLQCNTDATKCNTEIDIEIDIDKEIDKEKEKSKNSILSSQDETMPALISFPTNKKDELYHIYEDDVQAYRDLYPNVDIMQELRKMKGWLNANPTKRKTYKGLPRFINNWLAKEQDKPHRQNLAYASDYEETQTNTPKEETDAEMPKISREEYTSLMDDIEALMKGEA